MTANGMYQDFSLLLNASTETNLGYDDKHEVSRLFNIVQLDIVKSLADGKRNILKEGIDIGKVRDDEFNNLKVYTTPTISIDSSGRFPNNKVYTATLSNTEDLMYLYNLAESVEITYSRDGTDTQYKGVNVKPVNEDELNLILNNPFRQPDNRHILRLSYNRSDTGYEDITDATGRIIYLIGDNNTTIDKYHLSYIRKPRDIVVDIVTPANQRNCELGETIQKEIVRLAVKSALQGAISYNYEIAQNEVQTNLN